MLRLVGNISYQIMCFFLNLRTLQLKTLQVNKSHGVKGAG